MAAFTAAAATVAIPSFTGLKVESPKPVAPKPSTYAPPARASPSSLARASLKEGIPRLGMTLLAASAGIMVAGNANAIEVLLGGNGGELAFIPDKFQVAPGESIVFKNNAAFPHNVVFDEDEIPPGVDAGAISMDEEALLNAPGETYSVKLDKKGTYSFYCSPHRGVGMAGKVTVD